MFGYFLITSDKKISIRFNCELPTLRTNVYKLNEFSILYLNQKRIEIVLELK